MTNGAENAMTLKETLHGIVCEVCNKRFSGRVPAQQHLESEAHVHKVKLQEQQKGHPLWCSFCSVLCNSSLQYTTHLYSPRHVHMTKQVEIIKKQEELSATQIQLRDLAVGDISQTRNYHPGHERREHRECLGAEGGVQELIEVDKAARGFTPIDPPPQSFPQSKMNTAVSVPPDGVYFEYNRGHCYVCGIELTSLQHKTQHVEGKQHKKKALTFGSGGGTNDVGVGGLNGRQGVMMCSICEVPLSGEQNVLEHFSSNKHKTRKMERGLQRQAGLSDPAAGPNAVQETALLTQTAAASFSSLHGPQSIPGLQVAFPAHPPQPVHPHPASVSVPKDHSVVDSRHHNLPPAEVSSKGGYMCHMCDQHFQYKEEFIKHLQSTEHEQREGDTKKQNVTSILHKESLMTNQQPAPNSAVFDFTGNMNTEINNLDASHSLTSSQLSHKMSHPFELEREVRKATNISGDSMYYSAPQTASSQPAGFQAPLMSGTGFQDPGSWMAPAVEENPEQKWNIQHTIPEYVFNGSRGMCNVCKIDFTSKSHAESHLAGAKHKKALARWQSAVAVQAVDVSNSSQAFKMQQAGDQAMPTTAENSFSFTSSDSSKGTKQAYRFDGCRGYCFACKIELTSEAHANQHLVGKKHHSATERWIQEGEACNYPLFCNICLKPFTGQESAVQHFSSEKHKKKLSLSEGAAAAKKDPETGALLIILDGQMWYMCETCKCPLNTIEQFRLHVNSPRHNTEVEKLKKQEHSNRSSPVDAGDAAQGNLSGTRNSPDLSDLQHLVTKSHLVKTTPGAYLPQPQHAFSGLVKIEPGVTCAIKSEPGTQAPNLAYPETQVSTSAYGGMQASAPRHAGMQSSPTAYFSAQSSTSGYAGVQPSSSAYAPPGLNPSTRPGVNGCSAFTAPVGKSDQGAILKTDTINSQMASGNRGPPNQGYGGSGQRGAFSDLRKDLAIQQLSRGNTGSRGSRTMLQVLRPAGDYELDEEQGKALPQSALTTDYRDPNLDSRQTEDTEGSLAMSSIHGGYALPRTDEEKQQSMYASSTLSVSDRLTSIHSDPGSLNAMGYLQPNTEGAADQPRLSGPEMSLLRRFRYACFLCKQPMNTKEDYDRHLKGLKHQMKAATVSAPDKSREKLMKVYKVSSDEECHCCRTRPRKYQVELMRKAMAHDSTVVYLPTGTGKTLAAMMTLSCMLTLNPTRPVLFLVDKVLLVLQQARYIINELGGLVFERPHLTEDKKMEKRTLKVAVLCGGLSVRDGTPLWKHDVIVTTAAFCQNLLQDEVLRWANFSLVVFDEAHHCTKNHPYNKLLTEHHNSLPVQQRPKVLGLTASPAGRRTEEETLVMLKTLLENLGGATIAIIEDKEAKEQLDLFSSSARLVPVCVPMTEAEMGFHEKLLSYFIRAYVELMLCSNLQQISSQRLQALTKTNPPSQGDIKRQAQHLMSEPDELSEMVQLAQTARMKTSAAHQSRFENIRMHVMTVGMTLLNSEDGIDFVLDDLERLFDPQLNKCFEELKEMGLPCEDIATYVNSLCDSAKLRFSEEGDRSEVGVGGSTPSSMSIFQELLVTLANPQYMNWDSQDSMALVLVRERKVAHKFKDHLKRTSFVRQHDRRVAVVVGHGAGSGEGEGMNLRKQDKVLQGIKSHRYDIVVATSVAEEGIDIPECQLVVCLNPPTTVKALVQMRGRARKKDSYFVVLCSSQREKEKLEDLQQQERNMKRAAARLTQQHSG